MKELIFSIFSSIAQDAMDKNQSITLRYENSQRNSKTFISESKADEDVLTMSVYPVSKDEEAEDLTDEEEEDDEE